jgi:hypothetical protein
MHRPRRSFAARRSWAERASHRLRDAYQELTHWGVAEALRAAGMRAPSWSTPHLIQIGNRAAQFSDLVSAARLRALASPTEPTRWAVIRLLRSVTGQAGSPGRPDPTRTAVRVGVVRVAFKVHFAEVMRCAPAFA